MEKIELNTIYNMDCLEGMKMIPDNSIDCVITDPPYGINFVSGRRKEKYSPIENDTNISFLDDFFQMCYKCLKDNTHIYVFCSWHNVDIFKQTFEKYFKLKNILVWEKNNISMGDLYGSYAPKHEFILFGHKGRRLRNGKRLPDIIKANKTGNKLHPTQKPTDLLEVFIEQSTNKGQVVLDAFMGSGSTAIACLNTDRNFVGFEIDQDYYKVATDRIASAHEYKTNE